MSFALMVYHQDQENYLNSCIQTPNSLVNVKDSIKSSVELNETDRRIQELLEKYSIFEKSSKYRVPNSLLYDALQTGINPHYGSPRVNTYNEEVENDIKAIVELMPETLNYIAKISTAYRTIYDTPRNIYRRKFDITPLAKACHNPNIPIHIIKLLLKRGARHGKSLHGFEILLVDLKTVLNSQRYSEIEKLFEEYEKQKKPFACCGKGSHAITLNHFCGID